MRSVRVKSTGSVFGEKILRSGRRVLATLCVKNESVQVVDHFNGGNTLDKENEQPDLSPGVTEVDNKDQKRDFESGEPEKPRVVEDRREEGFNSSGNKQCGAVYTRKRRRSAPKDLNVGEEYFRKNVRARLGSESCDLKAGFVWKDVVCKGFVVSCFEPCSYISRGLFSCFVNSVLRYIWKARGFSWTQLYSFMLSEQATSTCSSFTVQFLQDSTSITSHPGFFKVFGSDVSMPLFAVDFFALPFFFSYMHSNSHLQYAFLSYGLVKHPIHKHFLDKNVTDKDAEELPSALVQSVITAARGQPLSRPTATKKPRSGRKRLPRVSFSELTWKDFPPETGVSARRSSKRSQWSAEHTNPNEIEDGVLFFPIKSDPNIPRLKSNSAVQASCTADILVTELDVSYRERGAVVAVELTSDRQWFLVVKRSGRERFRLAPHHVLTPCFHNRITRALIWDSSDDSWKLEFPGRKDWFSFRQLYRECHQRNMWAHVESTVPVPCVTEVSGYAEDEYLLFKQPDVYISSRDEVTRALEKSSPIYDMDSGDENWLNKFNNKYFRDHECVLEDTFEEIISAFERGMFTSPCDYSKLTSAVDWCFELAPKEVLEAVYSYWMAKRRKKRSALVRVFECHRRKRGRQVPPRAVPCKKRSSKQRASQTGLQKQLNFLKEIMKEQKMLEEAQDAIIKVKETEAAARKWEKEAIVKRQNAQVVMAAADLVTYRATMALEIADTRAAAAKYHRTVAGG